MLGRWLVWAALLFAAYEILEDQPVLDELVAGGVIALLAATAVSRLYRVSETRYAARWKDVRRLAGVPLDIVKDAGIVATAILRSLFDREALKGTVEHLPFVFGSEKNPQSDTRRALVTLSLSIAPNRIVCLMDERGLFVHRLVGSTPAPSDEGWPF